MKKIAALIITMLLCIGCVATAMAEKPGDTVTVTVSVTGNPNDAFAGRIKFSFDSDALTFVSATKAGDANQAPATASGSFLLSNLSGLKIGSVGTLTFKVNDNAAPGVYAITVWAYDCVDADENEVSISVSAGSVTVESTACTNHVWDEGTVTTKPTCAKEGVRTYACTNSGCDETKTESIPKLTTHTWDNGTVTTQPTCTKEGVKTFTCPVCKGTKTEAIPAAGHDDGKWITVTPATCKKDGLKELQCSVCGEKLDSEVIPAAGVDHTEGEWATTTQPTCTEPGEKSLTCSVCGDVLDTEAIPATGHDEGEWVTVQAATCQKDGLKELQCTICGETLDSEVIPSADIDHTEGEWATTTEPTCTEPGEKSLTCSVCGDVLDTEEVPATGHDDGKWITVKTATREETGLKELHCTKCNELLDTAVIPVKTADYYTGNTACSIGPRFKDESDLTDKWYRFTPVDLSVDGVQTFDLIASDAYIIGSVTVTVADGMVTIDCSYVSEDVKVYSEFCTFLPSLGEITTLDQAQLPSYDFGEAISIADAFNGDTKVLLFICNVVDYHSDMPVTRVWTNSKAIKLQIEELKVNMD